MQPAIGRSDWLLSVGDGSANHDIDTIRLPARIGGERYGKNFNFSHSEDKLIDDVFRNDYRRLDVATFVAREPLV